MHDPADPASLDPWWEVFLGARGGSVEAIEAAEATARASAGGDGELLAVCARSWWAAGHPLRAQRALAGAERGGGREVAALLTLARGDRGLARHRIEHESEPGLRADAWCDLALLDMNEGDVTAASDSVASAVAACPDHLEAGRWARFLAEPAAPSTWRRVERDGPPSGAGTPALRDAFALRPTRRSGWISAERLHRRVLARLPGADPPAAGTALRRLQDAGAGLLLFALDEEYASIPASSHFVEWELGGERARSLVAEGRPAGHTLSRLWTATAGDPVARDDLAQFVVALATATDALAGEGEAAARWLIDGGGGRQSLWRAYAAWHGARTRPRASVNEALALLDSPDLEPLPALLCVAALRVAGEGDTARSLARELAGRDGWACLAREAVALPGDPGPEVHVGPRLTRRGLG
jgi:hypothetical protein